MRNDQFLNHGASLDRMIKEYNKYGSLVIGYDFDQTVHDFHKEGNSYEKVIDLLRDLKRIGNKLICWTAHPDLNYVEWYLKENEIPYDGINTGGIDLGYVSKKPFFSALLDDRAGLIQVYNDLRALVNHTETNSKQDVGIV